jgi:protein-tyrosine-phosphatase
LQNQRDTVYFVCSGNTCRSPMAEHLFRHALLAEPEPLRSVQVRSIGTSTYPWCKASPEAVQALSKVGISLAKHRSTPLEMAEPDRAIAFFCMTDAHRQLLLLDEDVDPARVFLVREWLEDDPSPNIPDPFGGNLSDYVACRDAIVEAIPSLLHYLRSLPLSGASSPPDPDTGSQPSP